MNILIKMKGDNKIPILEEVKKHFANALEVQSLYDDTVYTINRETYGTIVKHCNRFVYITTESDGEGHMCTLWDYNKGYAKIVSYTIGTIAIEEEDLDAFRSWSSEEEEGTTVLEVGSVYRFEDYLFKYKDDSKCYGFKRSTWEVIPAMWYLTKPVQEATKKEWSDKLLLEANNTYPLGSKYSDFNGNKVCTVKGKFRYSNSRGLEIITDGRGGSVYYNGVWAQKKL